MDRLREVPRGLSKHRPRMVLGMGLSDTENISRQRGG